VVFLLLLHPLCETLKVSAEEIASKFTANSDGGNNNPQILGRLDRQRRKDCSFRALRWKSAWTGNKVGVRK